MNHHLLVKSFLRESNETNSFSSMFLRNCHNQFKQFVKNSICSCFIIMQHPIIHLNHLLTMNTQTHDVHLFLLCLICENILLYMYAAERNVQILCQYDIMCVFPLGKEIIRADARRIKR